MIYFSEYDWYYQITVRRDINFWLDKMIPKLKKFYFINYLYELTTNSMITDMNRIPIFKYFSQEFYDNNIS